MRVRNADAFIALLEQQISTELLVLVNAESLPDDHPAKNSPARPQNTDTNTSTDISTDTSTDISTDTGTDAGHSAGHSAEPDLAPHAETADQKAEQDTGTEDTPGSTGAPDPEPSSVPRDEPEPEPSSVPRDEPEPEPSSVPRDGPEPEQEPELGSPGPAWWAGLGGRVDRLVPGLLLATGHLLPVREIHRLARTSSLVRLVMDADGQVLDMGRAVRLATKAQRKAAFARYATCWVQGCPLPATMCQIDHADNWSDGGRTDLRLLGPACQFHNRDRYRRPHLYQRRKTGKDRLAFTYTGTHTSRNTDRNTGRNAGGPINHPTRT
ncbi:hypothetical protein [Planotetraspora kaengkrachanensis]|uniref:hypothetical protein n=1 Tax=Planotetraspora kaengkrachanensis TaxID=575193 RepID=UPI0031E77798